MKINDFKRSARFLTVGLMSVSVLMAACGSDASTSELPSKESVILTGIKKKADLVTTEVSIRKLAIYDSSAFEQVRLVDPRTSA